MREKETEIEIEREGEREREREREIEIEREGVRESSSAQSQPLWYRAYLYVLSPVRTAMIRSCLWCGPHDDFHAGERRVILPAALLAVHMPEAVTVALLKLISRLHV